ncbi:hypothetical protein F9802_00530 [Bacillus aerolatus]|uniref:YndJ family transporter n=1 Tax=Bacillus aerolatus TaxID=2653354 RepID=A0A6I1FZ65_9BACI|nr:YndJ family protein [Bacillus aerolatus]KAB7708676.1 hypothetical protein F9802_00530 [Bacillus aerolatus]
MNIQTIVGMGLFLFYIFIQWPMLEPAETLLLLSVLLFVPLTQQLTGRQKRDRTKLPLIGFLSLFYPLAAFSAVFAVTVDTALLALIWFVYTLIVSLSGLLPLLEGGVRPISETAIDSGLIYLGLGGFWFFAYTADLSVMHFSKEMILLTAVHFHYSAFIIPVICGLLGRKWQKKSCIYAMITAVIILSPMTIAMGITYSRWIEFLAVFIYAAALYGYGFFVFKTKFHNKWAKGLLSVSAAVLLITILFSFIYASGRVDLTEGLTNRMEQFRSVCFDDRKLAPGIIDFYENTNDYQLKANIQWVFWFKPFAFIYEKISRHIQQTQRASLSNNILLSSCDQPLKGRMCLMLFC